ncbi:MAG: hypothetical protein JW919_03725 [Candidatus Omnitrophica bacterium]|nr:hypothetical protein [Candidatus Omnitrophota bacterium]
MSIIQEALKKAQAWSAEDSAGVETEGTGSNRVFLGDTAAEKLRVPPPVVRLVSKKKRKAVPPAAIIVGAVVAAVVVAIAALAVPFWLMGSKPGQHETAVPASHQEVSYKPLAAADPANPSAGAPDLVLSGIMYIEGAPRAIINKAVVREGGTVAGATVVSIDERGVILKNESLEITLTLKE